MARPRFDSRRPHSAAPERSQSPPETLTIEKLTGGGAGFARRAGGEPLFVRGALPGDTISVRQLRTHKGYSEAQAWDLVRPSAERRTPPCRYADRCGGCDVMALGPAAQRRVKHDMLVEILRRTGHIDASSTSVTPLIWNDLAAEVAANAVTPPRRDLHYRTRIRLHIDDAGRLGFLVEHSHSVVPIDRCLVATERVNQVLAVLSELSKWRPDLLSSFEQVEIRALGETPDLLWYPRRPKGKPHQPRRAPNTELETIARHLRGEVPELELHLTLHEEAPRRWREFAQSVALQDGADDPHDTTTRSAATGVSPTNARLWFAPGTFTQVNWDVNRHIVANLLANARRRGSARFLDLYCGAGNFSLPLLAMGLQGVGVESNPTSIAAATTAASRQQLGGRFFAEDVGRAVDRLIGEGATFDLIVLDPPRAGFREVVSKLRKLAPKHVFICACDPVTFARDLRGLLAEGFELETLEAYDMFPQTHHVECSAWLRCN